MPDPYQCRVVASADIQDFQNRINTLLVQMSVLASDFNSVRVEYSSAVITTYPEDNDHPIQKPYYSALIWFTGPIAIPV